MEREEEAILLALCKCQRQGLKLSKRVWHMCDGGKVEWEIGPNEAKDIVGMKSSETSFGIDSSFA